MKKGQISKLELMLLGLKSRLKDNYDYFLGIDIQYKSGVKAYPAKVIKEGDKLFFTMQGERTTIDSCDFAPALLAPLPQYDGVTIRYRERGATILVEGDDRAVKTRQLDEEEQSDAANAPNVKQRDYLLKPGKAAPLLKVIGLMTPDGKIANDMVRKYHQIDRFVELLSDLYDDADSDTLEIIDCACGKSYLSFALNFYLRELRKKKCHITGIDRNEGVIENSRRMAGELSYHNMDFLCEDLNTYSHEGPVNTVLSLHACDMATDMALYLGVRNRAKNIVLVPCCHSELRDRINCPAFSDVLEHGIFRSRFSDLMTDALRVLKLQACGYHVSVIEYISPLETPKNIMIKAKKEKERDPEKDQAYRALCQTLGAQPFYLSLI